MKKLFSDGDFYGVIGEETNLVDSNGVKLCVGDVVKTTRYHTRFTVVVKPVDRKPLLMGYGISSENYFSFLDKYEVTKTDDAVEIKKGYDNFDFNVTGLRRYITNINDTSYGKVGAATTLTDSYGKNLCVGDIVRVSMVSYTSRFTNCLIVSDDCDYVMGYKLASSTDLSVFHEKYNIKLLASSSEVTNDLIKNLIGDSYLTIQEK